MEYRCEYSELSIFNDPDYAKIACKYVGEVARKIGFDDEEIRIIERSVENAVSGVIEYSFEPGEGGVIRISCELIPEGLKVSIKDKGLPFDFTLSAGNAEIGDTGPSARILSVQKDMDEVLLNNLGHDGKEICLIKYLKNKSILDYCELRELGRYTELWPEKNSRLEEIECIVRPMKPAEAVEVSKCIYKTYGYSYPYDHVYYPEKLVELNKSGQMYSAVAIIGENEIAGHGALRYWHENARIAENSQGVIKPEFRSRGCFSKLTEHLIEKAKSDGLMGIFGQPVTTHTYSQQACLRFGLNECALLLAHIPATVTFKKIEEELSQRGSLLIHFIYLNRPPGVIVYPPSHHKDMITELYSNLGFSPEMEIPPKSEPGIAETDSVVLIKISGPLGFARIDIEKYGKDILREIKAKLKALCLKKIEVINLWLSLSDPMTFRLTGEFEKMGFFFGGILPGAIPGGDALILQYLNNVPTDYEKVRVESEIAKKLIDYVRDHDPNMD
ncbi:ATP-binding protein [Desulfococcaceae bacterium HSG8]|nr:ATP-binding protein [Desulfococcaceae bacterium HSG8]